MSNVIAKLIAPARVPAKVRLVATLKELTRLVQALPEPVCVALEHSGVVATWRSQLETVTAMTTCGGAFAGPAGRAVSVAAQAAQIVNVIRKATGR